MKRLFVLFLLLSLALPVFGAEKLATRDELVETLNQALLSLDKKYKTALAKDLVLTKNSKPFTRFELAAALAKAMRLVYDKFEIKVPSLEEVEFKDVKPKHWARKDIELLVKLGILTLPKDKNFRGDQKIKPAELKAAVSKLAAKAEVVMAVAPPPVSMEPLLASPASRVEKSLEFPLRPQVYFSGGWGNINEPGSGTNNWLGLYASASYGNVFKIWRWAGNYEVTGKYGFNQVNYIVPVGGGIVNENRFDLELNTIYPVIEFWGISGKLLLGAKYVNLSNPTAPTNFAGFNAGLITSSRIFDRKFLLRAFYSLPLARAQVSPSVLGQPSQLFDYEAALDAEIFSVPLLFGLSGEIMILSSSGAGARYYNNLFVRYFLF